MNPERKPLVAAVWVFEQTSLGEADGNVSASYATRVPLARTGSGQGAGVPRLARTLA